MLEPNFLSVPELADRWQQTERQVLEHGALSRLPLYFLFDGLMFDSGDQWLKSTGVEYIEAQREHDRLRDTVTTLTRTLERHAAVKRGQIKPSEFEHLPMQSDEVGQYRSQIDTYSERIDALTLRLEQRERERRKLTYYGYLRALPGAIGDILQGKPVAVMYAHHPERGMVAVEGRPVTLTPADLLASMAEVKAIESVDGQGGLDAGNRLATKPKQRSEAQDEAILKALRQMGHDPQRLPRNPPGKAGVKSQVWALLRTNKQVFGTYKVFKTAWQRLRDLSEIADAD